MTTKLPAAGLRIKKSVVSDVKKIMEMEKIDAEYICPYSEHQHLKVIDSAVEEHLTIQDQQKQIVGFIIIGGLNNENRAIELRRIVIKEKGIGYGKATLQYVKSYCFNTLGCHRLWLDVFDDNKRAIALYTSQGFAKEGVIRECILTKHGYRNLMLMSILENEFRS